MAVYMHCGYQQRAVMDYQHDCFGQQSVFVCVLLSRMRNVFLGGHLMHPLSLS